MIMSRLPVVQLLTLSAWLGRFGCRVCLAEFNEDDFYEVVKKMEQDIRDFAREVERVYQERCDDEDALTSSCVNANYLDCQSALPQGTCHGGDNLDVKECLSMSGQNSANATAANATITPSADDVTACNAVYDYTVSNVRILSDYFPSPFAALLWNTSATHDANSAIVPTICWTRRLDEWLIQKRNADLPSWMAALGEAPRSMYYGDAATGLVRTYPAQHNETCAVYDPRLRPWYIAASSGPKNVLLVLDNSNSMKGWRLQHVKDAALRILYTLTEQDYFNIVVFDSTARSIFPNLQAVTVETLAQFEAAIKALPVHNTTNCFAAFATAFDVLNASVSSEQYACSGSAQSNTALLFFTDGLMNFPSYDTAPVVELVQVRMAALSRLLNIVLFTYSLADDSESEVHTFPAQLACAVNEPAIGLYTKILKEQDIVSSLSSYHELFALGFAHSNFTVWAKPYKSSVGNRDTITVSAPVYDRTTATLPRFLGVVAMNFGVTALAKALGASTTSEIDKFEEEQIFDLVQTSMSQCLRLGLSTCQLEVYRRLQGEGSNCSSDNSSEASCIGSAGTSLDEESLLPLNRAPASIPGACPGVAYPRFVWNNSRETDRSHVDRACCTSPSSSALPWSTTMLEQCPRPAPAPTSATPFDATMPLPPSATTDPQLLVQRPPTGGSATVSDKSSGAPRIHLRTPCLLWWSVALLVRRL